MAESSKPSGDIPWLPEKQRDTEEPDVCGLCKTNNDIVAECVECAEVMCQSCTSVHQNIKLTKDHRLKTLKKVITKPIAQQQNQDTQKPAAKVYCSVHFGKKAKLFCYLDDCLVCSDCLLDFHKGHNCVKVDDIAEWARDTLRTAYHDLDTYGIQNLTSKADYLRERRNNNRQLCSVITESINKKSDELVAHIRSHQSKLLQENDNILKSNDQELEKLESSLKTHISDMEMIKSRQSTVFGLASVAEIILERKHVQTRISQILSDTTTCNHLPIQVGHFISGKASERGLLGNIVGQIVPSKIDIKIVSVFRSRFQMVTSICTIDENFWIKQVDKKEIHLLNTKAAILKTVKFDVTPIAVDKMSDGLILVSSYEGRCLLKMSPDGNIVKGMINLPELRPLGISIDSKGNILVCMVDESKYDITTESRRRVVRVSDDGCVIQSIELGEDNRPIFTIPRRVCENPVTLDICVVNEVAKDMGYLHILDMNGKVRMVYSGEQQAKFPFDPRSVICDSRGQIIVSDLKNNKIHLLDFSGQFLCYLLTEQSGLSFPRSMVIAKGQNLLVGFNNGQFCMIKYLDLSIP